MMRQFGLSSILDDTTRHRLDSTLVSQFHFLGKTSFSLVFD